MKEVNGSGVHTQERDRLREQIRVVMEAEKIGLRPLSDQLSLSHSRLSGWLNDNYSGTLEPVDEAVRAFLDRRAEAKALPVPEMERFPVVVETVVFSQVSKVLRACHLKGKIGVVVSPWGTGKTRTIREYVERNAGGVMLVECHHSFPARMVLAAIAAECGVEAKGSIHELLQAICAKLKGSNRLLVLDEAEHLKASVLDVVRRINDWAGIGIVYVGHPGLMASMQSLKRDYGYIWNRVRVRAGVERGRDQELADVAMLLGSVLPIVAGEVAGEMYRFTGGDVRRLEELFFAVLAVSRKSGKPIEGRMIAAVARQLDMEVAA